MAQRPIFVPNYDEGPFVKTLNVNFEWYPGYSIKQKQKSILSLHEVAKKQNINKILEISTKSDKEIGIKLSAFNLIAELNNGDKISVESAYQGSKIFEKGGPFRDLFYKLGREIKRDKRLYDSGRLIGFYFNDIKWELEPKNAFYDWLYINALYKQPELSYELLKYDGFSDIEFNPNRSINCQARAAALFVSLVKRNLIDKVISDRNKYLELILENEKESVLSKQDEITKRLLTELYPKLNKWRFFVKNVATLEASSSVINEFIKAYPEYSGMEENVIKEIRHDNLNGWFNYDYYDADSNEIYQSVKEYVLSLGHDINIKEYREKKNYTTNGKNKFIVVFKRNKKTMIRAETWSKVVVLYIKVNLDNKNHEPDFITDIKCKKQTGKENLKITLRSFNDLEKSKDLIFKSYNSN